MNLIRSIVLLLFAISLPNTSSAQQGVKPGKIDPKFALLENVITEFGPDAELFPTPLERADGVRGSLRYANRLTSKRIAELEIAGVEFVRRNNEIVQLAGIYPAFIRFSAMPELVRDIDLIRVEASWFPVTLPPLAEMRAEIGSTDVEFRPVDGVDGTGTLIASIDSGVDLFHPHFFHHGAASSPWIDVDNSGDFSAGDGVDLDDSGGINGSETLGILHGASIDSQFRVVGDDDGFQPSRDWLFVDLNRNGERDRGTANGFTDEDPGFGEPLFVVDDVNRNGVLDIDERLLVLETSKVRSYTTPLKTYTRGVDLIEAANEPNVIARSRHGTSVSSIMVGGQPIAHGRSGVAPGADLMMFTYDTFQNFSSTDQLLFVVDAADADADVLIHEWTNPFSAVHDGSGNLEAAMDAASQAGVIQVCPVGNLGGSNKHSMFTMSARHEVKFDVDSDDYQNVYGSFFWQGDTTMQVVLRDPVGRFVSLTLDGAVQTLSGTSVTSTYELTRRGTHHITFYLWREDDNLAQGQWTFELTGADGAQVVARVSDYRSGWQNGVGWIDATGTESTAVFPATADSAFGVGAYGADGTLREFSGVGPRIDGERLVDITAPDAPFAALAGTQELVDAGFGVTWFAPFGGTSGAGPFVAGAFALLAERYPTWSTDQYQDRLRESAADGNLMPDLGSIPNHVWGFGKLNVSNALYGEAQPNDNNAPDVVVTRSGSILDASGSSDPDGDALYFRFDTDHDGVFDTEWQENPTAEVGLADEVSRVEVRDVHGARRGQIVDTRVAIPDPEPEPEPDMGSDAGSPLRPVGGCSTRPVGGLEALILFGLFVGCRRSSSPRDSRGPDAR